MASGRVIPTYLPAQKTNSCHPRFTASEFAASSGLFANDVPDIVCSEINAGSCYFRVFESANLTAVFFAITLSFC
ncbi:MAG: hypothetical protein J7L66_01775 [Anaerolineaceae bacterium]|nr:hypothetical protein [Anaerolineaceae bacterium]